MTSLPSLIKHRNETYLTVCLINMWTNFLVEDAKHHQLTNCNFIGFCNSRRIIDMQLSGTFSIPCRLEMLRSLVLSGSGAFANCDLLFLVVCGVFFCVWVKQQPSLYCNNRPSLALIWEEPLFTPSRIAVVWSSVNKTRVNRNINNNTKLASWTCSFHSWIALTYISTSQVKKSCVGSF